MSGFVNAGSGQGQPAEEISIVVPAYNAEAFLERFFSCVVGQSYQSFRLIFVDDCSSDATAFYAQAFGELLGERFVFLQNSSHAGLSPSRNAGLDYVQKYPTTFVTFLDADDWFEDDYLEDLYTRAIESGAGLCVGGIIRHEETSGRILANEMIHGPTQVFHDAFLCDELAYINPCSYAKLYRFAPIAGLRFRSVLRSEDTCYLFDALPHVGSVAFTNRALYHYVVRAGSLSSEVGAAQHASMHECFAAMMPLFEQKPYLAYREQFETQVFIRSSIGCVLRRAEDGKEDIIQLAREERAWLDAYMPLWTKNRFLFPKDRRLLRTGRVFSKKAALSFAATCYKRGRFPIAAQAYALFQRLCRREVRI